MHRVQNRTGNSLANAGSLLSGMPGLGTGPGLACWFVVEPPAGIEPATPSLPWNHREPLCGPPFPQVAADRRGQSYRFSFGEVVRSPEPCADRRSAGIIPWSEVSSSAAFLPLIMSRSLLRAGASIAGEHDRSSGQKVTHPIQGSIAPGVAVHEHAMPGRDEHGQRC
jgi:hypothetical protein